MFCTGFVNNKKLCVNILYKFKIVHFSEVFNIGPKKLLTNIVLKFKKSV